MNARGLNYLNNRYQDPGLGAFVSVDPLVGKTGTPYLYGNGNPTTLSDPSGLDPRWAYDNDRCNDDGYYECATPKTGPNAGQQVVVGPGGRRCDEGGFIQGCGSVVRVGEPCNLVGNCGDVNAITRDPCSLVGWRNAQEGGSSMCSGSSYTAYVNALGSWQKLRNPVFTLGVSSGFCIFFCLELGISGEGPYIRPGIGFAIDSPSIVIDNENPECGTEAKFVYASVGVGPAQASAGWTAPGRYGDWEGFSNAGVGLPDGGATPSYKAVSLGAGAIKQWTVC